MRNRIVVSGNTDGKVVTESIISDSSVIYTKLISGDKSELLEEEYPVELSADESAGVSYLPSCLNADAMNEICASPFLESVLFSEDKTTVVPLSQQFSFVAGKSFNDACKNEVMKEKYNGKTLYDIMQDENESDPLYYAARKMFPNINPKTNTADISPFADKHTMSMYKYAALACVSGAMYPQYDDNGNTYFNPDGVVTVGEFIDSLLAIKTGATDGSHAKKSLDSMSNEGDFYNEGYNNILYGFSSPFYRLYDRREMTQPITRFELAYITVACWADFTVKYDNIYSGAYRVGVNADWLHPERYVGKYKDGCDYKVYKKCFKTEIGNIPSYDLNDYRGTDSMSAFRQEIQSCKKAIPLPMFMSLIELGILDLFDFGGNLAPTKEVSRLELAYFLSRLACEFKTPFIER